MAQHLDKRSCMALAAPVKGNKIVYDDKTKGFGIRVTANGAKSFILNYTTKEGRERRITIGAFPNWSVESARKKAEQLKHQIQDGGDPLGDIEEKRSAPTMAELCARFEKEHWPNLRPKTAVSYKGLLNGHIRPHFGKHTKVAEVNFDDIVKLHRKVTNSGATYAANRTLAVLSKMFSLAIRWGMRTDNPAKGIGRNAEAKRRRYLKGDELDRLTAALSAHKDRQAANVVRLLLLTGARRAEVLGMRWADIDLTVGKWTKPASTTKQKLDHEVPLSAPVRQLLAEIGKGQSEFVFPSPSATGHVVEIKKAWASICKTAGIEGLRIHDLRHSFASQLVSSGASLPLVGALLGHSNPSTTARYSHLHDEPQRQAVEHVGRVIESAGKGNKETEGIIFPFPQKR